MINGRWPSCTTDSATYPERHFPEWPSPEPWQVPISTGAAAPESQVAGVYGGLQAEGNHIVWQGRAEAGKDNVWIQLTDGGYAP